MKKLLAAQLDGLTNEIYRLVSDTIEKQSSTELKKVENSKEYKQTVILRKLVADCEKALEKAETEFEEAFPDYEIRYGDLSLKNKRIDFDRVRKSVAFHTLSLKEDVNFDVFIKEMVDKLTSVKK